MRLVLADLVDASALLVRGEVFESLRRSIRRAESVQKEGEELRRLHSAAAAKAEEAEREKSRIGEIKIELERLRERRRAERSLANAFSAADSFQVSHFSATLAPLSRRCL